MSSNIWLIVAIVVAFAFVIGNILFLRNKQGFKLPDNWQEIKKKNAENWQDKDD
ncbi:DUF2897 family protein [Catenovulum sp. SM1970]|uniref:DUF2897 family protein n=1 Tax=Marinifaba aquimaris TaxID=2741323 RepID=UPI001571E7E8|nr:DUF2897 family protein [Marinifaba aquimaris]NTS76031.1 DUF2897 family protein [Marinifaba aquimaris]